MLTSGFRLDAWSCRPALCCSGRVWWRVAAVSAVPLNYVADYRRLLQAETLSFDTVNEIDLEDDVCGFMLLLAADPLLGAGSCVHAAI
ncbi:hypothetical protein [Actinokineospora inagensis]|uniref:hypothetical protein n=1 Tax=Actinokineospora inagensis TaxID=103730 RepID=UPI0012F7F523|nr:hypothetical protein [Actinokineospora inagensis]